MNLSLGTRIYNHGDQANDPHFGTISDIRASRYGTNYEITPDPDSDRDKPYWIPSVMFSARYEGHGGTRFVTEEAYRAWQEARLKLLARS